MGFVNKTHCMLAMGLVLQATTWVMDITTVYSIISETRFYQVMVCILLFLYFIFRAVRALSCVVTFKFSCVPEGLINDLFSIKGVLTLSRDWWLWGGLDREAVSSYKRGAALPDVAPDQELECLMALRLNAALSLISSPNCVWLSAPFDCSCVYTVAALFAHLQQYTVVKLPFSSAKYMNCQFFFWIFLCITQKR